MGKVEARRADPLFHRLNRARPVAVGLLLAAFGVSSRAQTADRASDTPGQALAIPPALPEAATPVDDLAGPLVPGQTVQPIDLATALRLAGARDLDVAIARERVCASIAEL